MHYEIAIPSYKRTETLNKATLATLVRLGADLDRVTVWTATDEQREIYQAELAQDVQVRTALPGLMAARQHYHRYYPEGTPILNMDDDLYALQQKNGDGLRDPDMTLDEIVSVGFKIADGTGARIWGINPVSNGWFMRDEVTIGLRYICGIFYGSYAGDPDMIGERITDPRHSSAEDFEMSLKSFVSNGALVRLEYLTAMTKYFADGGIKAAAADLGNERTDLHREGCQAIASAYPDLCKMYHKAGGVPNLRLKTITHAKIPLEVL